MNIELTIVIPVFNEAESILNLASQIEEKVGCLSWECIWVNDGSSDNSLAVLMSLSNQNKNHQVIDLERNFGQSAALLIGFQKAKGKYIGTLDGDGQNDPSDLVKMVTILNDNQFDMINGFREKRMDSFFRRFISKIANGIRNWVTNEYNIKDVGCSTRVFRKECVAQLPRFKGMHRFLPTLVRLQGFKLHQIPVKHFPREKGKTKYTLNNRLWVGIYDLFAVRWMIKRMVYPKIKSSTIENHEKN